MKKTKINNIMKLESRGINEAKFLLKLSEVFTVLNILYEAHVTYTLAGRMSVKMTYNHKKFKDIFIDKLKEIVTEPEKKLKKKNLIEYYCDKCRWSFYKFNKPKKCPKCNSKIFRFVRFTDVGVSEKIMKK